jgi:hypothetical protein
MFKCLSNCLSVPLNTVQDWAYDSLIENERQHSTLSDQLKHPDRSSLNLDDVEFFESWLRIVATWPDDETIRSYATLGGLSVELISN